MNAVRWLRWCGVAWLACVVVAVAAGLGSPAAAAAAGVSAIAVLGFVAAVPFAVMSWRRSRRGSCDG